MITVKTNSDEALATLTIQFEFKGRTIMLEKQLPVNDPIEIANRLQSIAAEIRRFV